MQKIYDIAENEEIYIAYEDLQRAGDIQGLYTIHPRAGPLRVSQVRFLHGSPKKTP